MKLGNKVLLAILMTWVVFIIVGYVGSQLFLIKSYIQLESHDANDDMARAMQVLDQHNYSLYTFTSDWAHWTDLYNYIQGKNPAFINNNFVSNVFATSSISMISYWDKNDKLIVGAAYDLEAKHYMAYPKGIEKYIYPGSPVLARENVNKDLRGYILLDNGIYMIAAVSITDGAKTSTPIGAAVMLRYLSPTILQKISQGTHLSLKLLLPKEISANSNYRTVFETVKSNEKGIHNQPLNHKELEIFFLIRDVNNKPIGMFQMIEPRDIYLTGEKSIRYYLVAVLFLGVLVALLLVWLLRLLIIKRLEKLANNLQIIAANNELSRRVDSRGADELATVSQVINRMLDTIQISQQKLEDRVEERTLELKSTNIKLEQEIVERKEIEKELLVHREYLAQLAHYDGLTGLPNRIYFNEMLSTAIYTASKQKQSLAVMFIDLDRFKLINDALGHHTGDLVLKQISHRFQSLMKKGDLLARLGGDEFIILLHISSAESISPFTQQLLDCLKEPIQVNAYELHINASMGIAIYPDDGTSLEELQKHADLAMYRAKNLGGGNFQYFTEDLHLQVDENVKMEAGLRKAIKNNEFVLYYQPKLCTKTGTLMGVEALIRWESPEYGLISPGKFIPLAEDTGLIMQIGSWAMKEAARANKSWQDCGFPPISVAVNISAKQFKHQDIAQLVSFVLQETQLKPQYLELEITESAVMDNMEKVAKKLNDIKNMGVKISVDDFGTGYTSMNYLKEFPVSILKIDQNFVKGIPHHKNDVSITMAVIALAHSLGMQVVAEGVETQAQLQWLADYDCDIVQGYFLSRPLPAHKLVAEFFRIYANEKAKQ